MTVKPYHKISVVTPSFNHGMYIEETILSVLGQNYPNLEYIIIDGGSTDNSVEIIKKYECHLTHWVSERDKGQTEAINKGFRRCTGDIVAYLNSDDVYEPGVFQLVNDFFCDNPDVKMIYGDAEIIDANGNYLCHRHELPFDRMMGAFIGFGLLIPQPTAFWKRDIFDKVGYFNESYNFGMDSEFWSRVAFDGTIKHIDVLMAKARYHDNSKTVTNFRTRNTQAEEEYILEKRNSHRRCGAIRHLPFSVFTGIGRVYRLKRILHRFVKGHYFRNYKQRI
jgi:glycosyltransferase involved in cell wall biosynthesis